MKTMYIETTGKWKIVVNSIRFDIIYVDAQKKPILTFGLKRKVVPIRIISFKCLNFGLIKDTFHLPFND